MPETILRESYILFQCGIAIILGGLIGWERESAGKWAGFRTHMLLCLAATLFVRLGEVLIAESAGKLSSDLMRADPVRILEAIATGVAFLGAGSIFRDRGTDRTRGLTTAASLLVTAPIGVAVALEQYMLAAGVTFITLVVLRLLRTLEMRAGRAQSEK